MGEVWCDRTKRLGVGYDHRKRPTYCVKRNGDTVRLCGGVGAASGGERAGGWELRLTARWSVSAADLLRLLEEHGPDVSHVLSPGVNPANHALMLDRGGQVEHVSPSAFAKIFDLPQAKAPSLVVLNTCRSLKHAEAIAPHAETVVAIKDVMYDAAAIELATDFYDSLAFDSPVGRPSSLATGRPLDDEDKELARND